MYKGTSREGEVYDMGWACACMVIEDSGLHAVFLPSYLPHKRVWSLNLHNVSHRLHSQQCCCSGEQGLAPCRCRRHHSAAVMVYLHLGYQGCMGLWEGVFQLGVLCYENLDRGGGGQAEEHRKNQQGKSEEETEGMRMRDFGQADSAGAALQVLVLVLLARFHQVLHGSAVAISCTGSMPITLDTPATLVRAWAAASTPSPATSTTTGSPNCAEAEIVLRVELVSAPSDLVSASTSVPAYIHV